MIVVKGIATVKKAGSGNLCLELAVETDNDGTFGNIYAFPFDDETSGIETLQNADVNDRFNVEGIMDKKTFTLTAVLGEIVAEPVCQPSG